MAQLLLPCPFCGSSDVTTGDNGTTSWANCLDCFATIERQTGKAEKAAAQWNRRAAPDVERLVEALTSFVTGIDVRRLDRLAPDLAATYRTARDAAEEAGFDLATHAGFRALVLAALGFYNATTTRPQAAAADESEGRT
jgi:Lar family restriction alleviation protein